ncbi:SNF2 domain-containing protein / helicase domain-containing protein / F-box family protein [Rhynchospora pubera]|uniref:SNF2 domain-containing protein / helicase domain-containing protein / F-box family protein n=1 Tax=Rhynchospora pubera TaxID=906938 RepID=A0AAV8GKJ1_9POAL|nr:SNF2 domain-containing protein / helicase domain-containing protein / F-box family protein [Rhynchospora pubera]
MEDPQSHPDHKLCGFLRAVVSLPPSQTLPPLTPCNLSSDGRTVCFNSDSGLSLLPIECPEQPDNLNLNSSSSNSPADDIVSKRRRSLALARRSASVIHQLHLLVSKKCAEIEARVLRVYAREIGGVEERRAVVLVDVYLPISIWSGRQFPAWRGVVVSLFKHVSCDWEFHASLLSFDWAVNQLHKDEAEIWFDSTCNVLSCEAHRKQSLSTNKKCFDLHDIFKSLPGIVEKDKKPSLTRIRPDDLIQAQTQPRGIWDVSDDVLSNILTLLRPRDLIRIASTCLHLRSLAASVMPCMKLKLFQHQEAAVEWMLSRERYPPCEMTHPLCTEFCTKDGFPFYIHSVSGKVSVGVVPQVRDFRGGLFCDEPGLGKTVTALSLILKTHGTLADPPQGADVTWCMHRPDRKCGYYEVSSDDSVNGNLVSPWKRFMATNVLERGIDVKSLKIDTPDILPQIDNQPILNRRVSVRCSRNLQNVKKKHVKERYEDDSDYEVRGRKRSKTIRGKGSCTNTKRSRRGSIDTSINSTNDTWVQCDACRKWRKLSERNTLDASSVWFCSMNEDPSRQSCAASEEAWDSKTRVTYLPGFYTKGTEPCKEENISFFTSILKEHAINISSETKKALKWLAELSPNKLLEMEISGLTRPVLAVWSDISEEKNQYEKIFQAFGLVRKVKGGVSRWHYPSRLENLAFDTVALSVSLRKPLNTLRFYLSAASLVVVPANLVDHWRTQIEKHVAPGQLHVYLWDDYKKKPSAHILAWDYDVVITTFSRLSAEWGPQKRSVLSQIHWYRVMLDEGHTLGSSLALSNKLQMAVSMAASSRWILTGTPTPNTPNSQVAHIQPMLRFLHEPIYGDNQDVWQGGIQKPFEAYEVEGHFRLVDLLKRTMISARKADLKNIPKCLKKVVYLNFNEAHAKSYNELVETVRRNILTADWNDPSHVESLLNPKQWKFRGNTIRNLRLSCCVAGHIKVTEAGEDIQETMDILVGDGLDPESEEYSLIRIALLDGCSCFRCNGWCRLPMITPCQHLLCLDCVALDSHGCTLPGCGRRYEMQSPENLARPENPNPKWPVPKDLIELQPSYQQDDWAPDWQSTSSSKVAYLVQKLKDLEEANKKIGYCMHANRGTEDSMVKPSVQVTDEMVNDKAGMTLPEKVIIFSQFLEHIHVIEQQLTFAGISFVGMYNPMPSSNKMKSLMVFKQDPNCMALIMDGSAALGLDLSFVTHVFLMEPIWDRSVEEQVVSRAHRMGATRPINVETLAMCGTIEEQMLQFLQDPNARREVAKLDRGKNEHEPNRAHKTLHDFSENNYLARLTFVRTRAAH